MAAAHRYYRMTPPASAAVDRPPAGVAAVVANDDAASNPPHLMASGLEGGFLIPSPLASNVRDNRVRNVQRWLNAKRQDPLVASDPSMMRLAICTAWHVIVFHCFASGSPAYDTVLDTAFRDVQGALTLLGASPPGRTLGHI